MPTGLPVRPQRDGDDGLLRKQLYYPKWQYEEVHAIEYYAERLGLKNVQHTLNGGQQKFGGYSVDGLGKNPKTSKWIAVEFNGCHHHGHECHLTAHSDSIELKQKQLKTEKKEFRLERDFGLQVYTIRECEWNGLKQSNETRNWLEKYMYLPYTSKQTWTDSELINAVQDGSWFGFMEIDIEVPIELRSKFREQLLFLKIA